jgi:NADH-quinone oxidoreductase subunit C
MSEPLTFEQIAASTSSLGSALRVAPNRVRVTVLPGNVRAAVRKAVTDFACDHFIQLGSVDTGTQIELHYHLTGPHRTIVTIAVSLPRDKPSAPTVSDLLLSAGLYERQVHDLMGVDFEGHPDLRRFILNEDWPQGEYPMRKDWKPGMGTYYGGGRDAAQCGPAEAVAAAEATGEGLKCPK